MIGVVKRIKDGGFYGFIESGGQDYFFHKEDFEGSWGELRRIIVTGREKVHVEFTPNNTNKGLRASGVKWVSNIS